MGKEKLKRRRRHHSEMKQDGARAVTFAIDDVQHAARCYVWIRSLDLFAGVGVGGVEGVRRRVSGRSTPGTAHD